MPDDDVKVGGPFVRLLLKVAPVASTFASLAPETLPKDTGDGVQR